MSSKKKVNFIITDLDDTIWDWLKMWHNSFEPYLKRISTEFNIDLVELKRDFQKLHQKYGTTEASFIYNELNSLTPEHKDQISKSNDTQKSILHEYYSLKKRNLILYKGVLKTLKKIKDKGSLIIGFTESNAFFTKYRLKHLELDGVFDYIYAPIDDGISKSVYRHYSEDFWEPEITEIRYLSKTVKKPAPEILEIIIKDFNAKKETTIYIGDKLDKDIFMANEASIDSIYAKYGHKIETLWYELLKEVTHWSIEDVKREKEFKDKHLTNPFATYTLENSFEELDKYFSFFEFEGKKKSRDSANILSIWGKVIDVQQHFNDIALRIRNIALTTFTFIIGGIGYLEKGNLSLIIGNSQMPYSSILSILGIVIMGAFFYMDRFWYHQLLVGAVKHGVSIEKKWAKEIPEISLTQAIANSSPHSFLGCKIHSKHKFYVFYGILIVSLSILGISLFMIKNSYSLIP